MTVKQIAARLSVLLLFLSTQTFVFAQQKTISGKITDAAGAPLTGVTIAVKGSKIGTSSNADGEYGIVVPSNESTLVFSYVGFAKREIKVGGQTNINVSLTTADNTADEVVVIGYGAKKRANVLGSVGTVSPKEIEDLPVPNLSTALVNKVPGVSISQSSGKPGSTTTLRIRNPITFGTTGSVEPLYVIDGIAYDNAVGKEFFDNLDMTMVESISFLKDAAASIYGSRGANGVVLITTKRGKPGKPKVTYSGSYGISSATNIPETLTSYEHATLLNNKYAQRPAYSTLAYTQDELNYLKTHDYNWMKEVWQDAYLQRHTVNVSGGSDRITFFGGANYLKETGNLQDLYATRYGFRIGATAKITNNLTADVSFGNDNAIQDRPTPKNIAAFAGQNSDQNDQMNATIGALMLIPRWTPMYVDGKAVYTTAPAWHPKEVQNTNSYARTTSKGQNITASLNYKVPFVEGLSVRLSYGNNTRDVAGKEYYVSYQLYDFQRTSTGPVSASGVTKQAVVFTNTPTSSNPVRTIRNGNSIRNSTDRAKSYQLNQSINYKRTFGKHDIDVLALAEQSESSTSFYFASAGGGDGAAQGQVIPGVDEFWGFTTDRAFWDHSSTASETGRASYLGRLNYSYDDKYLLEASLRADASPNFPPESRWGYFPSVAVGWKVSEEKFFMDHVTFVNDLKLRVQVGATGSDAVANYQYYERYTGNGVTGMLFGNVITNGINPSGVPNKTITWEKALYKNFGADGSFFGRRFNFSLDYYTRKNTDMLQQPTSTVPSTFGSVIADRNYAAMKSWGFEGALTYNGKVGKDFTYTIGANIGWSDNKVLQKYYGAADTGWKNPINRRTDNGIEGYQSTFIFRTQADIDNWYKDHPGWKINGDSARLGYLNFADINGDGVITEADKTRIATRSGSLFGIGFNLGAGWKGIKFAMNISLAVGGTRLYDNSARRPPTENQGGLGFWRDSWSPTNPNAKYPVINSPLLSEASGIWMVSGTNMRINNMQLSYQVPTTLSQRLHIPDFRAYVVATNVGDIINNQPYKNSATNVAVDYPSLRTITFGVNVSL